MPATYQTMIKELLFSNPKLTKDEEILKSLK
jgi:hypothetical protein